MTGIDWSARRAGMVRQQLERRGIRDPRVLDVIARVPRERFVPDVERDQACEDRAVPIGHGQTISQPFMVAIMTEALQAEPGQRVLEVGTGSGYQAAVLAELGLRVFSVERVPDLAEAARETLTEAGYHVQVHVGDGSLGWPEHAPYDRILVTAGAPAVPPALLEQLAPDSGRLVAPVGPRVLQELVAVERSGNEWRTESLLACRFVPLIGEEGW